MSSRNKKRRSKSLRAVAVVYFAVIFASPLIAADETVNLAVSAVVVDSCTVAATFTGFGTLTSGVDKDAEGTVTILCTSNKSGTTIVVGGGDNKTGAQRQMKFSSSYVPYHIYSDSDRNTAVAPDGTLSTFSHSALSSETVAIYFRALGGAYTPGTYEDSLDILVTYSD